MIAAFPPTEMYSQNDEEACILEAVGARGGRFLDIGANDGAYLSNTLALVERGWGGVLVEPSPWIFSNLLKRHGGNPGLALVHAAVGLEYGLTRFWDSARQDGLSTTEERQREQRAWQADFGNPFVIPVIPLSAILERFPGPVDVLSIDTEGTSVDLFLAFPLAEKLPLVACVEHDGRIEECMDFASNCGYRVATRNAENLVFAR
jgi:FkbM family methyltransferase